MPGTGSMSVAMQNQPRAARVPLAEAVRDARRRLSRQLRTRALANAASWVGFVVVFLLLVNRIRGAGAFVSVPVMVAGALYGRRAGIVAGLLAIPLNIVLYRVAGRTFADILEGAPGLSMMIVVGGIVGWMRDLRIQVEHEVRKRRRAERSAKRARRAETLAAQEARLLREDRLAAVGTLAAGASHEINNPLSVIVANLSYLRASTQANVVPADAESACSDALAAAERIKSIVTSLRSFASGGTDARSERCDVVEILNRAIDLARPEIEKHGSLVLTLAPVPRAWGDASRLGQVFLNLLVNAAQALPTRGSASQEVRVSTSVDFDGHVVIEIRDTGDGIAPENLAGIFDPFFSTRNEGTGLGLSVSLGIVRSLGGEILVDTEPGNGSAFRVLLAPALELASPPSHAATVGAVGQVKGALFLDYVRMLRAHNEGGLLERLRPEDAHYLHVRIDPDAWYPMDTFERLGLAILESLKPSLDLVRNWGYAQMDGLAAMNPELVARGDARTTLFRFRKHRSSFFDFPALAVAAVTDGAAMVRISYGMSPVAEEAAAHQTLGALRRLLELAGAEEISAWFSARSWADDPDTTLQLRWSGADEAS